jgi:hypothetical protein
MSMWESFHFGAVSVADKNQAIVDKLRMGMGRERKVCARGKNADCEGGTTSTNAGELT